MDTAGTNPNLPWLCVLASGSSGNCSVLTWHDGHRSRAALIDLGLSPRRTRRLLCTLGLSLEDVTDVFLTHLDADHFHSGWMSADDLAAPLRMHRRHLGRASRCGIATRRTELLDGDVALPGLTARVTMGSHDDLGVCSFRFAFDAPGAGELGFATDVGRMTADLIDHLAGVDVLAIESNYCPKLELASDRPIFLKRRIMGGSGHLSNAECARAARDIRPGSDVVLLHLSRQCNRPDIALAEHRGAPYRIIVSTHDAPTTRIPIARARRRPTTLPTPEIGRQHLLFPLEASA